MRILFCHINSLSCLPALNRVFDELGDHIGMVISSARFESKHGGFWDQTLYSVRSYGARLTLWFGFDLIAVPILMRCACLISFLLGRAPGLLTLPALAARQGAQLLEVANINDARTLEAVATYAPDLIVVMNFDQILRPPLIALARRGALNVHPGALPELRGPCPVIWALAQGRNRSAASIHLIENEAIDAGPLLAQVEVPIRSGQSVAQLNAALFLAGAEMLRPAIEALLAEASPGLRQDLGRARYLGFPTRVDMVTFHRTGHRLCRVSDVIRLILPALVPKFVFRQRSQAH